MQLLHNLSKPLAARTRREHYRLIEDKSTILPSESESDEEMPGPPEEYLDNLMDSNAFQGTSPPPVHDYGMDDEMDLNGDSEDLHSASSDSESNFQLDAEDEWLDLDEGEERDEYAGQDEMARGLEEMLGAEEELELWNQRMYPHPTPIAACLDLIRGNEILSKQDRDNIRAFKLKILTTMPQLAFA
jgi:hypothetical protein